MTKKSKRTSNGKGSMSFNEKTKRYHYQITYYDDFGNRKRKSIYGKTKNECYQKEKDFRSQVHRYVENEYKTTTICDLLRTDYVSDYEAGIVKFATYKRNLYTLSIIEESGLKNIPIYKIQEKQIQYFLNNIKHKANSTIDKVYQALNKAFRLATYYKIVDINPMDSPLIKKPVSIRSDKDVLAFNIEEQKAFLNELNNYKKQKNRNYYKAQFLIAIHMGLRIGEINALQVSDIDLINKTIKINKTITESEDENDANRIKVGTTPKTDAGNRTVNIPTFLLPDIKEAIDNMVPNKGNYVFMGVNNKFLTDSQVNSAFKRLCDKCLNEESLAKGFSEHCLRHTFATRCIESGMSAAVLKSILGHADISTTLNNYFTAFEKYKQDSLNMYENYMKGIL